MSSRSSSASHKVSIEMILATGGSAGGGETDAAGEGA